MHGNGPPRTRVQIVAFHKGWLMLLCVFGSVGALVATMIIRSRVQTDRTTNFCTEINLLNAATQNLAYAQIPTAVNLRKIIYYQQHPSEVQARILREKLKAIPELRLLVKAECGGPVPNLKLKTLIQSTRGAK